MGEPTATPPSAKLRLYLGGAVFFLGQAAPLAIPLVVASDLDSTWKGLISGALLLGIPELFMVIAIFIMGKEGFAALKASVGGRIKGWLYPRLISPARFRFGLTLFALPLASAWTFPYVYVLLEPDPGLMWKIALGLDLMFISSFLVLGERFQHMFYELFRYQEYR